MSALYGSSLFDSDDMAEASSNGFHAAKETLQITVTTVCPICMESLLVTKHPFSSLPLIVHTGVRWGLKRETEVAVMLWITL
jgi:hypothetical protein